MNLKILDGRWTILAGFEPPHSLVQWRGNEMRTEDLGPALDEQSLRKYRDIPPNMTIPAGFGGWRSLDSVRGE
jgi:hypothetical protein